MIIECDDNVYNPLCGWPYVFEKDIANFLLNKFNKNKIVISIGEHLTVHLILKL